MIKERINQLRKLNKSNDIDGYIVPKNDGYFSEYAFPNRLKTISNFSGSAGFAIILKNQNYLFVDGRYTLQAKMECGKYFKIFEIPKIFPFNILKKFKKKLSVGFDPKIFTNITLNRSSVGKSIPTSTKLVNLELKSFNLTLKLLSGTKDDIIRYLLS